MNEELRTKSTLQRLDVTRYAGLLLVAILIFAVWLRLPGQLYPVTLHNDEGHEISSVLCQFPPQGEGYHPYLSRLILTPLLGPECVAAKLQKREIPRDSIRADFAIDPAPYLHAGRAVALLFGMGSILLTFFLGRALGGTSVGLAAALILAVTPIHVIVSNNLRFWALASFLNAALLLSLIGVVAPDSRRWRLALSGALFGLAFATVYVSIFLGAPLLVALVARWRAQRRLHGSAPWFADLATVGIAAVIVHLVANFPAFQQFQYTIAELTKPTDVQFGLHPDGETPAVPSYLKNLGWYFGALFDPIGAGALLPITGILGLILAARRGDPMWLALTALIVAVLLVQPIAVVLMANRYIIPTLTVFAVASGWLAVTAGRQLAGSSTAIARLQPALILSLLVAAPGLYGALVYHRALRLPPTREQAREWVETHIPPGTAVMKNIRYMSPVIADCKTLQLSGHKARPCYEVRLSPADAPDVVLNFAATTDARFLIFTASTPEGTLQRLGGINAVAQLRQRYELLARFQHPGLELFKDDTATVNPAVEIYRLKPD